ncbi:MAG: hypothetical protein Q9160_000931 [Pyrenula sp. 1 TL-2023]
MISYLQAQGVANLAKQSVEEFAASRLQQNSEKHDQLTLAAWTGDLDYVRATVNADWRTHEWSTYFFGTASGAAAIENHDQIVQFMFDSGRLHHLILHKPEIVRRASAAGHAKFAKLILEDYHDIILDSDEVEAAIEEAAENGHYELLRYLMSSYMSDPEETDQLIVTIALPKACEGGQIHVVRNLLSCINLSDDKFQDYHAGLVYRASHRGHADIVELLLPLVGMHFPKWCTSKREDTLAQTARCGHLPVIRLLLQHGFPVDGIRSTDGYSTPLCRAVEHGQYAVAELLLDRGARVEGRIGAHIMTRAIESGEFSMVRLLAARGCDINQGFHNDKPPIVVAAREKQWAIEKLLEELGAVKTLEPLPPDRKVYSTIVA